jgi:DNA-directed RNA polymerase specialized sigma24 family protein
MPSDDHGSVTRWLDELRHGDPDAAGPLWERYFERLVRLARRKLRRARDAGVGAEGEDAALSAFDSFCRAAAAGRFPKLDDRDGLWRLLVTLTDRKATDRLRRAGRRKRGGGRVRREADLDDDRLGDGPGGLDRLPGPEPTPEFAAMVAEECRCLLERLGDEDLRGIALRKLEGYTDAEIAAEIGCARRTVVRRLELIRTLWSAEAT